MKGPGECVSVARPHISNETYGTPCHLCTQFWHWCCLNPKLSMEKVFVTCNQRGPDCCWLRDVTFFDAWLWRYHKLFISHGSGPETVLHLATLLQITTCFTWNCRLVMFIRLHQGHKIFLFISFSGETSLEWRTTHSHQIYEINLLQGWIQPSTGNKFYANQI